MRGTITTAEERIARVEGILEGLRFEVHSLNDQMNALERRVEQRFNQLDLLLVSMWVTLILGIVAMVVPLLFRR